MMNGTVLSILIFNCYLTICCSLQQVCIIPESGSQNPPSYCELITTIDGYCRNGMHSNVVIHVLNGTHNVSCIIADVNNITLKGHSKMIMQCSCNNLEQGFQFINVTNLCISEIEFIGCGDGTYPSSLLLFVNGSNLTLTNVTISSTKTGFYIENVTGIVTLNFCKFMMISVNPINYILSKSVTLTISNTLFMQCGSYTSCISAYVETSPTTINCTNTNFTNNSYGDMQVIFNSYASLAISKCNFNGGFNTSRGLLLYFRHQALVYISHSIFNKYFSDFGSGVFVEIDYAMYNLTILTIFNSTFTNNKAISGGAGIQVSYSYTMSGNGYADIHVINSRFSGNSIQNTDLGGKAISCLPYGAGCSGDCLKIRLYLSNSTFWNNNGTLESIIEVMGIQAYVNNISINSNNGSAIIATGSSITFSGATRITNNCAHTGAGLVLDNSFLRLESNAHLLITNNTALTLGGGMLIQGFSECNTVSRICFLEIIDSTALLTLIDNRALGCSGHNIFGNYGVCPYLNESLILVPSNNHHQPSSISSHASKVCFYSPDNEESCVLHLTKSVYPGIDFTIPLRVLGFKNGTVAGSVTASISGGNVFPRSLEVDSSGQINATYTMYSDTHNTSTAYLALQVCDDSKSVITIIFQKCTLGFNITYITNIGFKCECIPSPAISSCSQLTITKESHSWIGVFPLENSTYFATSIFCPLDYCNYSLIHILSLPSNLTQDMQCHYSRTGILCGSCPEGLSFVLGSSQCRKCSSVWLLLILPFALVGLLLVVVIHFLNLTVTMGTVCGLIFYANIIQDYSVILLSTKPVPGLTPLLQIFLSWVNLDLGVTSCFYNGMEAFGKAILLFAFPVYIWLISATIMILSDRYIFFTKLVGENAVKVLSTLFLLSYSKAIRATVYIFNFKTVNVFTASNTVSKMRWAADGNIPYLDPQRHLAVFMIAVLFITLLLPYTLSLLCIRHAYSLSNFCRVFSWINRLKPFFDTHTGPFKDKTRFWPGLLLFVRLLLAIVHALDYKDRVILFYINVAACLFLSATMIMFHGVYKKRTLNILEHFFILNLSMIFLINTYKGGPLYSWQSISSHLLVSTAFLAFLGILTYHVYLKISFLRGLPQSARYEPLQQVTDK